MKRFIILLLCTCILILSSCGGTDNGDNLGELSLKLTDSATEDYNAVWVTISAIEVRKEDQESEIIYSDLNLPITVNLLSLQNGVSMPLGFFDLEPGHYTQIRLHLGNEIGEIKGSEDDQLDYFPQYTNCIYEDGNCYELTIPSGYQSGIKLTNAFDIQEFMQYELILDFDARMSVHKTGYGAYKMRPTIRVIKEDMTGTITGVSEPGATIMAQAENTNACGNIRIAQTTTADETGTYKLSFLEPGTYTVVAVKKEFQPAVKANIEVIAGVTNNEQDLLLSSGDSFSLVSGQVSNLPDLPDKGQGPRVKAITSINDTNVILDYSTLSSEGLTSYTLNVPQGDYTFYFCADNEDPVLVMETIVPGENTVTASF